MQRMVERKGDAKRYPLDSTQAWLGWLAQQMRTHNQTIFSLEHLQPDWLSKRQKNRYRLIVRLIVGLIVGLLFELIVGLLFGLLNGLGFGLLAGLSFGIGMKIEVELTETLAWSWKNLKSGLLFGLLVWLLAGLFFGLLAGLLNGLLNGLLRKQLTERLILSPNEGVHRSLKNGLLVWLLAGLGFGLSILLLARLGFGLSNPLLAGLGKGLLAGLGKGLGFGLGFGLDAALQHYILRFWLWRIHSIPFKAVPFLEDATARILLRRVGGGYSFTHRLLLDYFADLDLTTPSPITPSPQQTPSP